MTILITLKRTWYKLPIIFCLIIFITVYLYLINNTFEITEISLKYDKLPESFNGYKIALISDLHDKNFGKNNNRLIEAIKNENPDIITMAGDMHGDNDDVKFINFIKALAKVAPLYYAEGNHESPPFIKTDYDDYIKALTNAGAIILNENSLILHSDSKNYIKITGMNWHLYKIGDISFNQKDFNILLLHNPFAFDDFAKNPPDLMLSGHIHGGVVRLPFIGGLFSPGAGTSFLNRWKRQFFFPKYSKGVYNFEGHRLVVTTGLGNTIFPFRLIRPEIVIITLIK